MLLNPMGSALHAGLAVCPTRSQSMLGHRIQSLWLLTLTRVRQSFCVINNSPDSPLLEKQHDKIVMNRGWVCVQPPQP